MTRMVELDLIQEGEFVETNNNTNNTRTTVEDDDEQSCRTVVVCPSNETQFLLGGGCPGSDGDDGVVAATTEDEEESASPKNAEIHLRFLTNPWGVFESSARAFEARYPPGAVSIEFVKVDFSQLFPDIINEARSQTGLYDGFLTPPSVVGSVVAHEGWKDLTSFIQESADRLEDWSDILLGYRQYIAQYEGKIIMFPLDGDILSLYYRTDALEAFDLKVPRTWDEYNTVAAAVHGKQFNNETLVGSCIGRVPDCAGAYWANLVISSLTQTQGQKSGHLFDPINMQPLGANEAVIQQALEWMETQTHYGPSNEFEGCIDINMQHMYDGKCVLTYNWGNQYKEHLKSGSMLQGKIGVAPTPGSTRVLDRTTNTLVDCTEELCKYGDYYDDIGWVNRAPYLAFGGWSCAINNYSNDPRKQRLATEFCAFASSRQGSIGEVVQNATGQTFSGQDPFRESHLNEELYVQQGYEEASSKKFLDTVRQGIGSPNVVTDIRFPTSNAIYSALDVEFANYLNRTKLGSIPPEDRPVLRTAIAGNLATKWQQIIAEHDQEAIGTSQLPILESYQRLRDVYVNNINLNQLGDVRYFGFVLGGLVLILSMGFGIWTQYKKRTRVVRASQPPFLLMVCFGAATMGASILLMAIDDEIASPEVCSNVCVAIPWLYFLGWVIVFSALHSKLRRVYLVFKNAKKFKRLKVTAWDVLPIFAISFSVNFVLLLAWTIIQPPEWVREMRGELDSYGSCSWHLKSNTASKVLVSLLGVVNFLSLVLANVAAFRARNVSTEYGESKFIGMAMASILQAILVAVPLFVLVDDNPSAQFFIQASFVFIVALAVLLLLFVPKVHASFQTALARRKSETSSTTTGLAFRVINTDVFANEGQDRIREYRKKLAELTILLSAEGIDADEMYQKVGLNSNTNYSTISGLDSIGSVASLGIQLAKSSKASED